MWLWFKQLLLWWGLQVPSPVAPMTVVEQGMGPSYGVVAPAPPRAQTPFR